MYTLPTWQYRVLRLSLVLGLAVAQGCLLAPGDGSTHVHDTAADDEVAEVSSSSLVGNTWGDLVQLRDNSNMFSTGKPAGGWFVTPIHVTLLSTGKLLVTGWGRRDPDHCGDHGSRLTGTTFILDPDALPSGTLNVQPLDEARAPGTQDVLYCSGHTPIADGRVLYVGGSRYENFGIHGMEKEFGLNYSRLFSPTTTSFSRTPTMLGGLFGMQGQAWYPTNTRMPDGRVLTIAGFARCCDQSFTSRAMQMFNAQEFDAGRNPWSLVAAHDSVPFDVGPGLRDYVHTVLLPKPVFVNGQSRTVAMMGANGRIVYANVDDGVAANQRFASAPNGSRPFGAAGWDSTAALISTGEFMTMGGTDNDGHAQRIDLYQPLTNSWRSIDTGIGRRNASSVLLPDGTVLLINGGTDERNFAGDRRRPQIFDPVTGSVSTLAPWTNDSLERGYHNFAVLLKDGRVLIGGGISPIGGIGCERTDMRIYNPPYFSKGTQPVLSNALTTLALTTGAAPVQLSFSGEPLKQTGGVVLLATGSTTHSFDQNQRYVPLTFTQSGTNLTITPPATPLEAPPGDYMMFLVSQAGVPSVARHVRVTVGSAPVSNIRRTVVFIRGQTVSGQDMFVRGGLDHGASQSLRGVKCENADGTPNFLCAIPITHRNLRNTGTTVAWKTGDTMLDWYGPEAMQTGISHNIRAAGTAFEWTTNNASNPFKVAVDGFGFEPLNDVGDHLWMLDVDMDCSKTINGWFEVKSFIAGPGAPGWEADVQQAGTPYTSNNHFGRCGMVNYFSRGSNEARINPLP